jgi:hypothetical protein
MAAVPGKIGVTVLLPGAVCGFVDSNSRLIPVSTVLFMSRTVAVSGCALFKLTVALVVVEFGNDSVMEVGGQVEKKPALDAYDEFETEAEIRVDPGWLAVATPF